MMSAIQKKLVAVQSARVALKSRDWNRAMRQYEELVWEYEDPAILEGLSSCYEKTGAPHKAAYALRLAQTLHHLAGRHQKASELAVKVGELELFSPYFES